MKHEVLLRRGQVHLLAVALLLLTLFAQQAFSARQKAVTVDEPAHLTRGYVYLHLGDLRFHLGHPVGMNALNALPLLLLNDLTLPTEHPSWKEAKWYIFDDQFFWRVGNDVERMMTLGRLPTMFLALLVASVVYRWATDLWDPRAGLLALLLCVFSPNFVAHTRLATTDLGQTAGFFLATFLFWRFLRRPSWLRLLSTGVAFGLAQTTKFSAMLLVPVLGLTAFLRLLLSGSTATQFRFPADGSFVRRARDLAGTLAVIGIVGLVVLWAVYGFELRPALNLNFPIPAATHFEELDWVMEYFDRPHAAYLNGQVSDFGWWYYFPITFLLKTPIPLLLLAGWGLFASLHGGRWRLVYPLLVPFVTYWIASLTTTLNIGHRHLLPVLPFLFVLTSRVVEYRKSPTAVSSLQLVIRAVLIGWYVLGTLRIYPHYLAYFNELAGGPEGGWRYLVDSNIDWGQDLSGLRRWMRKHSVDSIYLSYFGTARASAYGIDFVAIPTWEPALEKGNPFQRVFEPSNPAPGYYAISVTNLFGSMIPDHETFAWFRERNPVAHIGYSIYIYQVAPTGPPVNIALSGLQIDELSPKAIAQFGTNDLHLRWFDARHSLVSPSDGTAWTLIADGTPLDPALVAQFTDGLSAPERHITGDGTRTYAAYRSVASVIPCPVDATTSPVWWSPDITFPSDGFERHPLTWPVDFGPVVLTGYVLDMPEITPGSELTLLTCWRTAAPDHRPLKIFVHLLDASGQLVAGQDRLDVAAAGWHAGDIFVQIHRLKLPTNASPEVCQLEMGWYDGETLARLPVHDDGKDIADRLLLRPVTVK